MDEAGALVRVGLLARPDRRDEALLDQDPPVRVLRAAFAGRRKRLVQASGTAAACDPLAVCLRAARLHC